MPKVDRLSRRKLLLGAAPAAAGGLAAAHAVLPHRHPWDASAAAARDQRGGGPGAKPAAHGHGGGVNGPTFRKGSTVDHRANGFNPTEILRDFDWGKTRRLASGRVLREWEIVAYDKEIEVAPGVKFPSWAFAGRVPGPTLRCREGETLRVRLVNGSAHPHTMHFHGFHRPAMDGIPEEGAGVIAPGQSTTYEFDADPFGLHLYHCHVGPLAEHIARGLYGAFIIDPRKGRPDADEMVMVMNGFNTNFDAEGNQTYAVNTVAFHYVNEPVKVSRSELVRIYLVNILEYDPINSFHIHGHFFDYYPTGTSLRPAELTDTVVQAQGQRGICELRFRYPGQVMFHAHKSEFAELGWMGFFEVG
jgi:FtsP/CotA-like multicopper oxidase with cupredoxin domain